MKKRVKKIIFLIATLGIIILLLIEFWAWFSTGNTYSEMLIHNQREKNNLRSAREKWEALNISNYQWETSLYRYFHAGSSCLLGSAVITVENNKIVNIDEKIAGCESIYRESNVNNMFDIVEQKFSDIFPFGGKISLEFDPKYYFVSRFNIRYGVYREPQTIMFNDFVVLDD